MQKKLNILICFLILIVIVLGGYMLFFAETKVTDIYLSQSEVSIYLDEKTIIVPTITPEDATDKTVIWKSSNESIAIVDNGEVIPMGEGEVDIIASDKKEQVKAICHVRILAREVDTIELTAYNMQMEIGEKSQIGAKAYPENASFPELVYESSDENIVKVDANGFIEAKGYGAVEIIVTDTRKKSEAKCSIVVKKHVEKISFEKDNINLTIGKDLLLNAIITPEDATDKTITWSSSDENIVMVDENGMLKAKRAGTATITATATDGKIEASTTAVVSSFGAYKHVFIIGVDGVGAAYTKVSAKNFKNIFGNYAYRHDAKTENITISAQNWGSILNGVTCETHKYTNDSIASSNHTSNSKYLSIFYYVRKAIPEANLVSIVHWGPINRGIIESDIGVKKHTISTDAGVKNKVIDYINNDPPTLMFVDFDEVDETGHLRGGFSKEYYNAVSTSDGYIGQIYDAISKKGLANDSLFIVVADHGHTSNGHGGNTKEERSAVVAVRGYSVNKTILGANTHNRDVSAIALYALGVEKPSSYVSTVPSGLFINE